jgi:serine/arginine repetitive matrix protein 2
VNGLRDDDVESAYPSRGSYASEYSAGASASEGVQILFKDHTRSESKSSSSSYAPRRQHQAKDRPDTKVNIGVQLLLSSAHVVSRSTTGHPRTSAD